MDWHLFGLIWKLSYYPENLTAEEGAYLFERFREARYLAHGNGD